MRQGSSIPYQFRVSNKLQDSSTEDPIESSCGYIT